ncbi:phenylalanine--tRNA ligase subunit beta [Paenibacillus chartarius]|uniref:Phenylalanine--tRNA ligase beta subunit n=1 Tax=Paenibacillus chartarius TaxID=747481 RepID=A0ABV6DEA9_9BACL
MKVSYQWLNEYVDTTGCSADELAERMPRAGVEVDGVESRNKGVSNTVVGYVKSREKHPDADKLSVCIVDVGTGEDLQIVCGAKNVAAGQKVPVAMVGAKLPGDLAIKRAKLRGVESQGMICSAKELGLNDKLLPKEIQEGILVLPEETQVGASILDVLGISDEVLELDLTPNRSDCLSMIGVAHEVGAILGREVRLPDLSTGIGGAGSVKASDRISVRIEAKEDCTHYAARLIEGVRVGPSPLWMQNRLMAAGIRPISNIVDITNYVMLEFGQPLHAFDADTLDGGRVVVRRAVDGEVLETLDGVTRKLEPHMLLITDGVKPVGLAGVMGGLNSEVTEGTTRILLESAKFAGRSVRKTSRQLGLRSEASLRFEKEVNPEAVIPALNRAASLIAQYASGVVAEGIVEERIGGHEPVQLTLDVARVNGYLGTSLSLGDVQGIIERLGFAYQPVGDSALLVTVPSRRGDITRVVDLIEEVARLYGYDHIPTTLMSGETTPGSLKKEQRIRRLLRSLLTGAGLHEAITYSFTHPSQKERFPGLYAGTRTVSLAMPMSEERSELRTSLIPHLMDVAVYNRNRTNEDVALFEIAKAYSTDEERLTKQPVETPLLAVLLTGSRGPASWNGKPGKVDFYDAKGLLERVAGVLGFELVLEASEAPGLHPGRTANVYGLGVGGSERLLLGRIGQLHPALQQQADLDDTYVFEVELPKLVELADDRLEVRSLPRFPAITRDMAVVVDRGVAVGGMTELARKTAGALLESIQVFDVYTGDRIGADKKSVAISLVYRHTERTLQDEEVTALHAEVVKALEENYGAELRK